MEKTPFRFSRNYLAMILTGNKSARLSYSRYCIRFILLAVLFFCTVAPFRLPALAPERIMHFAGRVSSNMYPDADTVIVYDSSRCSYDLRGLGTETYEEHRKIITERGRRDLSSITFGFNSTYEKIDVEALEVISAGGKRTPVDIAANSRISIDHSSMGENIYDPAHKVLSLSIPELAVGDTVRWKIKRTSIKSRTPGKWSNLFLLQSTAPILAGEVMIEAPADLPLISHTVKSPVTGSVICNVKKSGGRIVYHWQFKNIPQLIPEQGMPSMLSTAQRLLVSTAKDWQEISKWYYNLCRPRLDAVNEAMRSKVRELTAGKKSDMEKITALFQFVSQEIRYLGITAESNAPGYEPHDVSATFDRRHGVCRDKAALLASMLELAGFKAYPVLFYSGSRRLDREVPQPFFNHAVTAVEKAGGGRILMDPTFENTSELFPAWLAEQSYLVAKPEGADLAISPPVAAGKNALEIKTTAELKASGILQAESELIFNGINDQMYRSAFLRWSGRQRRDFLEKNLRAAISGAELESLKITPANLRDTSQTLSVKLKYHSRGYMPVRNGIEPLPLPILGKSFGALNYLLSDLGLQKRKFALRFDATAAVKESYTLKLPPGMDIIGTPPAGKSVDDSFVWENVCRITEPRTITGKRFTALPCTEVSPREYLKLRQSVQASSAHDRILPLSQLDFENCSFDQLKAVFPDSDTIVISDDRKFNLLSESEMTMELKQRIKVLTYAGVKSMAELKYAFDPARESASIDAEVILPDGSVMRPEAKEINIMDAEWVASAPRYPATKIIVAALPKVVPGAEINYTLRKKVKKQTEFRHIQAVGGYSPVFKSSLAVELPAGMELRISDTPVGVNYSKTAGKERARHLWKTGALPPVPKESSQPPHKYFRPSISVYYPLGWKKQLANWQNALENAAAAASPEADAVFRELGLTGKGKNTIGDIIKIRDWCSINIRPAGPPAEILTPEKLTSISDTIKAGYGHAADRAAVIAALLRRAGIKYDFTGVKSIAYSADSAKAVRRFPDAVFANILVWLPEHGIYLNDTDQYAAAGSTASENKTAVDLKSGRIISIRPQNSKATKRFMLYRISMRTDGSAVVNLSIKDSGNNHRKTSKAASEMTPEERRQYFENLAASISPSAVLQKNFLIDASNHPCTTTLQVKIPDFAALTGRHLQFELPGFRQFAAKTGSTGKERLTPLWFNDTEKLHIRYEIEFPFGFTPVRRRAARQEIGVLGDIHFREYTDLSGSRCTIDCRLTLPAGMIRPENYPELLKMQQELAAESARRIILKSDAAVIRPEIEKSISTRGTE